MANTTDRMTALPGRTALGSRVLDQRNQTAVAVGAWVESGTELWKHPAVQASLTEELVEERRHRSKQNLHLFQENVRQRVAQQERLMRREWSRAQPHVLSASEAERSSPCDCDTPRQAQCGTWSVRQSLAGPSPLERPLVSTREAATHMSSADEAPVRRTLSQHKECVLELSPDQPVSEGRGSRVLWPMDQSKKLRRQRQSQILMQRRLFLSKDRQNVKENEEYKRHLLKTASLKEEKERARLEEERRLGEAWILSMVQQTLEQREQQVEQTLRQEAAEGAGEAERRHRHVPKTTRQMNVLRAQLRELFPGPKLELPPLCCCGSFWESHPDTCANNCVFYNNPKAYIQALQIVVHCWDLL